MDQLFDLTTIVSWIDYIFPSLSEYTKLVIPGFMIVATILGIFTKLLPLPNHHYPVPDLHDLEIQLGSSGNWILSIARFARSIAIGLNWFLASTMYASFYITTAKISNLLGKLKGNTPVAIPSKSDSKL